MSVELNRQVAALMGWRQVEQDTWIDNDEQEHIVGFMTNANFNPAGCENSAGLVQDRMAKLGWLVDVCTKPLGHTVSCMFRRGPDMIKSVHETRPLAICRAFVQAMERWVR